MNNEQLKISTVNAHLCPELKQACTRKDETSKTDTGIKAGSPEP